MKKNGPTSISALGDMTDLSENCSDCSRLLQTVADSVHNFTPSTRHETRQLRCVGANGVNPAIETKRSLNFPVETFFIRPVTAIGAMESTQRCVTD